MMRIAVTLLIATSIVAPAQAQEVEEAKEKAPELVVDKVEDNKKKDGVDWHLDTGATFNLNDNRSVVGQPDGTNLTFGYKADLGVEARGDGHEWRNTVGTAAGVSYTSVVQELIKSRDATGLETIYLYHIVDWFGPFARFALETALFSGADIRATPTTYAIARPDGTTDTIVTQHLSLTDPFRPTRLKESLGLFAQPVAREPVSVEIRAGGGARHIFAEDQLAIDDDADTPPVEVKELLDVHQVGVEGVFEWWGSLVEKKMNYKLTASVLIPLWHNDLAADDDRGVLELTNFDLHATLSVRVVEWASLDYELAVIREPQLIDAWQVRNNLVLTFGIATGNIEPDEKKPPE